MAHAFWVREGREIDFERIFGPQGIWPEILKRSEQYLGSELRFDSETDRRFKVFDYWESHIGFEQFRCSHQADVDRFDRLIELEGIVDRKQFLGMFYMNKPDDEDGQDLVPS